MPTLTWTEVLLSTGHLALALIVVGQSVILVDVLRETLWLKRLLVVKTPRHVKRRLPTGSSVPAFSVPFASGAGMFRSNALPGRKSLLLFAEASPISPKLAAAMHALWHKVDGHLFVVCQGGDRACVETFGRAVPGFPDHTFHLAVDADSEAAHTFAITDLPQAVLLDADARIEKYGRPAEVEADHEVNHHA